MYSFIRRDLGIPFYCGQHSIDIWLQKILDSIEGRKIETVLQDIFTEEDSQISERMEDGKNI